MRRAGRLRPCAMTSMALEQHVDDAASCLGTCVNLLSFYLKFLDPRLTWLAEANS